MEVSYALSFSFGTSNLLTSSYEFVRSSKLSETLDIVDTMSIVLIRRRLTRFKTHLIGWNPVRPVSKRVWPVWKPVWPVWKPVWPSWKTRLPVSKPVWQVFETSRISYLTIEGSIKSRIPFMTSSKSSVRMSTLYKTAALTKDLDCSIRTMQKVETPRENGEKKKLDNIDF